MNFGSVVVGFGVSFVVGVGVCILSVVIALSVGVCVKRFVVMLVVSTKAVYIEAV